MADELEPPASMVNGTSKRWVIYKENHVSFGKFILSDQVRDPVAHAAEGIAALAAALTHKRTGALAGSYQVRKQAGTMKVHRAHRVQVDVFNDNPAAASEEFGNSHVGKPGHRALGRAGAAFGDFHGGKKEI